MGWYCVDWIDLSLEVYNNSIYLWKSDMILFRLSLLLGCPCEYLSCVCVCVPRVPPKLPYLYTDFDTAEALRTHIVWYRRASPCCFHFFFQYTPEIKHSPPKNRPSQKETSSSSNHPFSGAVLVSGRVKHYSPSNIIQPPGTTFSWLRVPGNKAGKCWRTSVGKWFVQTPKPRTYNIF